VIQVYGQIHNFGSFANVTCSIVEELKRRQLDVGVYGTGAISAQNIRLPIAFNNASPVGLYVGYPEGGPGWLAGHRHQIMVTVCETDRIPQSWVQACNAVDLVVVPSLWCKAAFERSGVRKPLMVVPHGVHFTMDDVVQPSFEHRRTTFLHVSGALSFPARKGTSALLLAFKHFVEREAELRHGYRLVLKMPKTSGVMRAVEEVELSDRVDFLSDESLSNIDMARLIRTVDCVVQPSRAEGFGIVPLEARCLGTPTIMTSVTGHAMHFVPGVDVEVAVGAQTPLETQANPIGSAPSLTVEAIVDALESFDAHKAEQKHRTVMWAKQSARLWTWFEVLKPLVKYLREVDARSPIKPGGAASLRGTE
jgi:glycosyltransferase involved in cell wall biosynthesis